MCIRDSVNSKDNPADCATRGLYPSQLVDHCQWWQGPEWLRQPESQWPATEHSPACDSTEECITNPDRLVLLTSVQSQPLSLLQHVSSYSRLIRVTSWILRYIHNSRHQSRRLGTLTTEELKEGEGYWFKEIQHLAFPQKIKALGDNRSLPRSSRLITFRPFIDDEGLLLSLIHI